MAVRVTAKKRRSFLIIEKGKTDELTISLLPRLDEASLDGSTLLVHVRRQALRAGVSVYRQKSLTAGPLPVNCCTEREGGREGGTVCATVGE